MEEIAGHMKRQSALTAEGRSRMLVDEAAHRRRPRNLELQNFSTYTVTTAIEVIILVQGETSH